ncbi:hypothetical protein ACAW74_12995 [Fibrella sp. WM1]|uniref:hypothetical protein n=1 Tax=Fibrella musci TaxID=3242485 RepID=UPI00351F9791
MITPDNQWQVIDAYLHGLLDEAGRAEVDEKLATDPDFRAEMALQLALHQHLNQEQRRADEALVDNLMTEWATESASPDVPTQPESRIRPLHPTMPFWQRTWVRAAAALVLLVGLGWPAYMMLSADASLTTTIVYEQRSFGAAGTPDDYRTTTYLVTFVADGSDPIAYSTDGTTLTLYVPDLPADDTQWRLRDDPETGGFQLTTPTGQRFALERNTYGKRQPL